MYGRSQRSKNGPGSREPRCLGRQRPLSAATTLSTVPAATSTIVADDTDTVIVRSADLVLRRIKLKQVATDACESDDAETEREGDHHDPAGDNGAAERDHEGCEEIKVGPLLVSVPLGTTAVSALVDVTAPAGQYDRVQFKIHAPRLPHDSAFIRVNPGFDGISVQVTGTFSHKGSRSDFTYMAAIEAEQEADLSPPITVDASQTASLTLRFDISSWFAGPDCVGLVDPATGNAGGANEGLIRKHIRSSIDAFEDEDRDGHDDHGDHHRCAGPAITLDPTSVTFGGAQGGANPPVQTVSITNGGGGTLSGLGTSISYGTGQGWLSASLSSTTAPSTLTAQRGDRDPCGGDLHGHGERFVSGGRQQPAGGRRDARGQPNGDAHGHAHRESDERGGAAEHHPDGDGRGDGHRDLELYVLVELP